MFGEIEDVAVARDWVEVLVDAQRRLMFARISAFPQVGKSARLDILNAVSFVQIEIKKNFILFIFVSNFVFGS
jgi:hypothetical protein